jgi:hypothetical protein
MNSKDEKITDELMKEHAEILETLGTEERLHFKK